MPVTNPAPYSSLLIRLLRDHGAMVFMNVVEAFHSNRPAGAINYLPKASRGADKITFYTGNNSPTNLVTGTKVLAVEIHQSKSDSGDLSFNLQGELSREFSVDTTRGVSLSCRASPFPPLWLADGFCPGGGWFYAP